MDNMDDLNFDDIDLDSSGGNDSGFGDLFDDGGSDQDIYGQNTLDPNQTQQNNGSDYFADDMDDASDITDDQRRMLDKKYIIVIAVGIVIFLLVLFLGSRILGGKKNNSNEMLDSINNQQQQVTNENTNVNVDNIMNNGTKQPTQNSVQPQQDVNVNYHKDENEFSWMEVTDSENVVFEQEYAERIFTITTVKHYARTVDSANNLVIKTTLTGSLSGLPGTYIIEVPYSKGVKLKTGNSFTVNVMMGTYNDKIVVGDITY